MSICVNKVTNYLQFTLLILRKIPLLLVILLVWPDGGEGLEGGGDGEAEGGGGSAGGGAE
jgi:uncharacterized membrane protein YgcG